MRCERKDFAKASMYGSHTKGLGGIELDIKGKFGDK